MMGRLALYVNRHANFRKLTFLARGLPEKVRCTLNGVQVQNATCIPALDANIQRIQYTEQDKPLADGALNHVASFYLKSQKI